MSIYDDKIKKGRKMSYRCCRAWLARYLDVQSHQITKIKLGLDFEPPRVVEFVARKKKDGTPMIRKRFEVGAHWIIINAPQECHYPDAIKLDRELMGKHIDLLGIQP